MTHSTKHIILLLLATALFSLILLSASLSNLQLHPGTPFPGSANSENANPAVAALPTIQADIFPFLQGFLALIFVVIVVYLPARLIGSINIKRLLALVVVLGILLFLIRIIPPLTPGQPSLSTDGSPGMGIRPSPEYLTSPLGEPPQLFAWIVLLATLLALGVFIIKTLKQQPRSSETDDRLLREAENALRGINSGQDFKNVIIRCYWQMVEALREERGMERSRTMTAREFVNWLVEKGIPSTPAQRLTDLFEKVRYGAQQVSENDQETGIESLNRIVQYCRKKGA